MRVALYARVSTGQQAERDLSLPDQIRQMEEYCRAKGWFVAAIFIEAGASARDEHRPEFQRMVASALGKDKPFDVVMTLTTSRFFRDATKARVYKHKLESRGVRVLAIHQEVSDDPMGKVMEGIFELIDQYESDMNGFHTLRAMQENARQGFFNGSSIPYGYKLLESEKAGRKGNKKKLVINPEEAAVVRMAYELYVQHDVGIKGLVSHFYERGILRRGRHWSTSTVSQLLANSIYCGEYWFNKRAAKSGELKPIEEWVKMDVEGVITRDMFDLAQRRRESRSPKIVNPKRMGSQTLLTGLLKCGYCGGSMTVATGKHNQYRYYRCTTRNNKHKDLCQSRMVRLDRMDAAILDVMCRHFVTPARVAAMLSELQKNCDNQNEAEIMKEVSMKLETVKLRMQRLYDAIEQGLAPLDADLKERLLSLTREKEEVTASMEMLADRQRLHTDNFAPEDISEFCAVIRDRLFDQDAPLAKQYLKKLVKEIVFTNDEVKIVGGYAELAGAIRVADKKNDLSTHGEVLRSSSDWLPSADKSGHQWEEHISM